MADPVFPAQQPAYMGEWIFNGSTSAPPANTHIRLNNSSEKNATAIYVSNLTVNAIDSRDILMGFIPGCSIRLENKNDATKWHVYTINGEPIQQSGYVELKGVWQSGGGTLLATSVMLSPVSMVVRATGRAIAASAGTTTVSTTSPIHATVPVTGVEIAASTGDVSVKGQMSVVVEITGERLRAEYGHVAISGQLVTRDFAFPFQGTNYTSPGMTLRQWYAGQAIVGFIAAAKVPAANLMGGKLADYAFKLADSMIEFEKRQADGVQPPLVGARPRRVA